MDTRAGASQCRVPLLILANCARGNLTPPPLPALRVPAVLCGNETGKQSNNNAGDVYER